MNRDEGEEAEEVRNSPGYFSYLVEHKAWAWTGSLLGVVGLAVSLIQVVDGWRDQPAQLQIQSMQFVPVFETGSDFNQADGSSPDQIEVAVKNSGDAVSRIEKIQFVVDYTDSFRACALLQLGATRRYQSSFTYLVGSEIGSVSETGRGSNATVTLPGGSVRSLRPTLDVRGEQGAGIVALYGVKVALIHDGGQASPVGSISFLKFPFGKTADFSSRQDASCIRKELDKVENIFAHQSLKSPSLESYKDGLRKQLYAS